MTYEVKGTKQVDTGTTVSANGLLTVGVNEILFFCPLVVIDAEYEAAYAEKSTQVKTDASIDTDNNIDKIFLILLFIISPPLKSYSDNNQRKIVHIIACTSFFCFFNKIITALLSGFKFF